MWKKKNVAHSDGVWTDAGQVSSGRHQSTWNEERETLLHFSQHLSVCLKRLHASSLHVLYQLVETTDHSRWFEVKKEDLLWQCGSCWRLLSSMVIFRDQEIPSALCTPKNLVLRYLNTLGQSFFIRTFLTLLKNLPERLLLDLRTKLNLWLNCVQI